MAGREAWLDFVLSLFPNFEFTWISSPIIELCLSHVRFPFTSLLPDLYIRFYLNYVISFYALGYDPKKKSIVFVSKGLRSENFFWKLSFKAIATTYSSWPEYSLHYFPFLFSPLSKKNFIPNHFSRYLTGIYFFPTWWISTDVDFLNINEGFKKYFH